MRRLTPALTTVTAAMVLAAACSSSSSTTLEQVRGTVVDQRTGKPVAQARVEATAPQVAMVTGSTDAQGRFTLRKISKQATLKVTAASYQLASLQVGKGPLEVKLTPIPVVGKVTSGLTRAGLPATLHGKAGARTQTRPDGSFEVYGVGQGDTLTVSAAGCTRKSVTIIGVGRVEVVLSPEPATEVNQVNQWVRTGNLAARTRSWLRLREAWERHGRRRSPSAVFRCPMLPSLHPAG
jgi:Carboxypeptidase regulatory-like domain